MKTEFIGLILQFDLEVTLHIHAIKVMEQVLVSFLHIMPSPSIIKNINEIMKTKPLLISFFFSSLNKVSLSTLCPFNELCLVTLSKIYSLNIILQDTLEVIFACWSHYKKMFPLYFYESFPTFFWVDYLLCAANAFLCYSCPQIHITLYTDTYSNYLFASLFPQKVEETIPCSVLYLL